MMCYNVTIKNTYIMVYIEAMTLLIADKTKKNPEAE